MSKRKDKKERVKQRWDSIQTEIENLFLSLRFEPFTEWKDVIENEMGVNIYSFDTHEEYLSWINE